MWEGVWEGVWEGWRDVSRAYKLGMAIVNRHICRMKNLPRENKVIINQTSAIYIHEAHVVCLTKIVAFVNVGCVLIIYLGSKLALQSENLSSAERGPSLLLLPDPF